MIDTIILLLILVVQIGILIKISNTKPAKEVSKKTYSAKTLKQPTKIVTTMSKI